ncbi:MAG TPA: outer membrane protein assembly factor BamE [Rhodoferax sp.]|nr:outer membrane protein assembly factor BamE [Rhodoferax sp.]
MRATFISRHYPFMVLLALPLLQACSSYAPPKAVAGISREALVAQMGAPDMERRVDGGSRLEFPRGPFGKHTWFIYLDPAGQATRAEQVLTEQNFGRIRAGMTQDEVRQLLGRPSEVQGLARSRGEVWSYRYENFDCKWFQVELSVQQQVRSAGYGQPPECLGSNDVIIPASARH